MSIIPDLKKSNLDNAIPTFQNKVSRMLASGNERISNNINPFLDRNGNLVNPYINYQKMLDSNNVSAKAKDFIHQATGLSPTAIAATAPSDENIISSTPVSFSDSGSTQPDSGSSAQSNSGIVNAAKNYIGTPYVWGGESMAEGGMDCSGFVYNALKDAGYKVGRTTAQGYRSYGTSVSKSDLQPGDLVFFGKNNKASHIGIYIGNGKMIHSSGGSKNTKSNPGKGVSITNVNNRSDFLEAKRY